MTRPANPLATIGWSTKTLAPARSVSVVGADHLRRAFTTILPLSPYLPGLVTCTSPDASKLSRSLTLSVGFLPCGEHTPLEHCTFWVAALEMMKFRDEDGPPTMHAIASDIAATNDLCSMEEPPCWRPISRRK